MKYNVRNSTEGLAKSIKQHLNARDNQERAARHEQVNCTQTAETAPPQNFVKLMKRLAKVPPLKDLRSPVCNLFRPHTLL